MYTKPAKCDYPRSNWHKYLKGPPGLGRCIADLFTLVVTINTLQQLLGPTWSPAEVRLLAGDEGLLGDPVVFGEAPIITGQRYTSFTISRSHLQLPVPRLVSGRTPHKKKCIAESQAMPADFVSSAEQLIRSLLVDGYPSIQTAADAAGMSSRTLQRRLAKSGLTYTGLVSTSRLRFAKSWLSESDMPIAEIAAMMGYKESTNFARAFRRQTGISPAGYRRIQARK